MPEGMTRAQRIAWCKDRAIKEMDYYNDPKKGIVSMMSDISKHPETASDALMMLCTIQLMKPMSRQEAVEFINGFN